MVFVGHERLRNKSWASGEGGRRGGTGNPADETGISFIPALIIVVTVGDWVALISRGVCMYIHSLKPHLQLNYLYDIRSFQS